MCANWFFATDAASLATKLHLLLTPKSQIFAIWRWVYENHGGEYLWYSKVDLDSYVNVDNWVALVDKLSPSDTFVYVGMPYPQHNPPGATSRGMFD
jgi:hypothetical protein